MNNSDNSPAVGIGDTKIQRNRREVILPFTLCLTVMLHNVLPGPIDWLLIKTGWKRA